MSSPHPHAAQTWAEVKADRDCYVWGEGWGDSVEQADREALSALSSKISLTFFNKFQSTEGQTTLGKKTSGYSSVENTVSSYSAAALCDSGMEVLESGRRCHVVRWIGRDAVELMRAERTRQTLDYARQGEEFELEGRPSDALRCYYWAYAMLKAYPETASASYIDHSGTQRSLAGWLPQKVNGILSGIRASVLCATQRQATIVLSFNGKTPRDVEFSYFDGTGWSRNVIAQDGKKTVPLCYNTRPEYLHIRLEYAFPDSFIPTRELEFALQCLGTERIAKAHQALAIFNK